MNRLICILFGCAVGTWIYLITQQQKLHTEGIDPALYKDLKEKCNRFFKVCKNLKTVKILISKTEKDIKSYTPLSPRRKKFQENLKELENKQVDLEIRYDVLTEEIDKLFSQNEKEIYSEGNRFDINAIRLKDLYKVYKKYREEIGI